MAPIWDETAQQQKGLPSVTVAPKHDESRRMKGVEWVCTGASPLSPDQSRLRTVTAIRRSLQ